MTPASIISAAQADGVRLVLSSTGTIKATGDGAAVNRWLAAIRKHKTEIIDILKVSTGDTSTASRWWLLHFVDREPLRVATTGAHHDELLRWYPDAVAAEPFTPVPRRPAAPMSAQERAAVMDYLARIEETDQVIIAEVIEQCQQDADARDYFTGQAALALPKPEPFPDDWQPGRDRWPWLIQKEDAFQKGDE